MRESVNKKKILISPLSWGLGHAVRIIPVIQILIDANYVVTVATTPEIENLLLQEFPELEVIQFPSVVITYSYKNASTSILTQFPKLVYSVAKEFFNLKKLLKKRSFDIIISDNRYGFFSNKTPSIFITHQLALKLPRGIRFIEKAIFKIHCKIINKFKLCLIPDSSGVANLSGELSHRFALPKNYHFIGTLSRFKEELIVKTTFKYDLIFILSGPEPQRTNFENRVLQEIKNNEGLKCLLIRGKVNSNTIKEIPSLKIYNHLPAGKLLSLIKESKLVICRSGYTSVMDLAALKKKAIFVPTPGQTEQEYLSGYLSGKNLFHSLSQEEFTIEQSIYLAESNIPEFEKFSDENKLIIPLIKSLLNFLLFFLLANYRIF